MRKLVNAEVLEHTMKLQQMGAIVNVINSKLCYVDFDISGFKLRYVYNINKKGNYFIERIKPYPLPLKEFENEMDVIEIITIDIEQFKNAIKSHHSAEFIESSREMVRIMKKFEDLYLYYNISAENIESFMSELHVVEKKIDAMKDESERLYFKKDPDNL